MMFMAENVCGHVTRSDLTVCWSNWQKNTQNILTPSLEGDMRNLWLRIKDWFTGQNSNDIIRAFIANRQNALECLNPQC
ncbi:hypothetical protein MTQ28_23705, partial [Escherichia coli]|nr:hypothetical protein [Escherichia coli]